MKEKKIHIHTCNTDGVGTIGYHMQKNEVGCIPQTTSEITSKWITDPNVRAKTMKLLEENIGVNLHDFG